MYDDNQSRTVCGCFILETLIAARLSRRPYLRRSDVRLTALEANGIEEWEPWQLHQASNIVFSGVRSPGHVSSIFNQLAALVSVLNDLISTPFEDRSGRSVSHATTNMEIWVKQLPAQCQVFLDEKSKSKATSPQVLNLSLAFGSIAFSLRSRKVSSAEFSSQDLKFQQGMIRAFDFAVIRLEKLGSHHLPTVSGNYLSLFGMICFPPH